MVDFIKLTRMNAMGKEVGPVFVNRESIVILSPYIGNGPVVTDITTGSAALLIVKETPQQIMQAPQVQFNENKS